MLDPTDPPGTPWPVAIFARNESRVILDSLRALQAAADAHSLAIWVLANGCTDTTEPLVEAHAAAYPGVRLVSLPAGDKAAAWNHYVHDLAPDSTVHFFTDAHVRAAPSSLARLAVALQVIPDANAAGALPASGCHRESWCRTMLRTRSLAGGLYALRGSYLAGLRRDGIRLPSGFIGDDTLISALARGDFERACALGVVHDGGAVFTFAPVSVWRPRDWQAYLRRRLRQGLKSYQVAMLFERLQRTGLSGMPGSVDDLYMEEIMPAWVGRGTDLPFLLLAKAWIRARRFRLSR